MNKKHVVLAICAIVIAAGASVLWQPAAVEAPPVSLSATQPAASDTCGEPAAAADGSDPARVPPGCCTSNCNVDADCNKICGPGNCVCIVGNPCCRRCTW